MKPQRTPGIERWMKHYAGFGRAELGVEMQRWIPESDQHRAAAIMLDEIDRVERETKREEEERRHREVLEAAHVASEKKSREQSSDQWWKKPIGIFFLSIAAALFVALCKMRWPEILR